MTICLSPNGVNTSTRSSAPDRIIVGTADGAVILSRESGDAWRKESTVLDGLHVSSLWCDEGTKTVIAGIHGKGIYRSTDDGITWRRLSGPLEHAHVYSLGVAQAARGTTIYVGTEPAALYRSDDLGEAWEEISSLRSVPGTDHWSFPAPPHLAHVKHISVDPGRPEVIYVGVEQGGLFKSVDRGISWRELDGYYHAGEMPYKDVHRVAIDPREPDHVYLSAGTGVFSSYDGGDTWKQLTSSTFRVGYPDALFVSPIDSGTIVIGGAERSPFHWLQSPFAHAAVLVSRDHGQTWDAAAIELPDDQRANIEAMSMCLAGEELHVFAGTTDGQLYASTDGAETFTCIAHDLPSISKLTHNAILHG